MMKRRVFGVLLSLCLVLALIPAAAFAETTLDVPYTINVVKGGIAEPGKTVFTLELMDSAGEPFDKVKPDGLTITTDGAVSYDGSVIIKGTLQDLLYHLANGVFVRQQNKGEDGWEYDPAVWYVQVIPKGSGDSVDEVTYAIYPAKSEETGDGGWLYSPTGEMKDKMIFTNTYTKSATEETPKPEVTTGPDDATPVPDTTSLPQTGDSSNLTGWLILLAVSAAAVAGVVVYGRRRKNAREE